VDGRGIADAARAALARLPGQDQGAEVRAAMESALDAAAADTGAPTADRVESLGAGWTAEEALAMALYCAVAAAEDPRRALLAAVNHSGDSDSTGAICGNLVGAALGDLALPWEWVAELEGRDLVAQVSDDLVREYARTATVSGPTAG
jgi:ADP-ribosylglycohydrolase